MPVNWEERLPEHSAPYTSTIVFLVRKGNPKGIKDWGDLAKPGISVVTPNPKTSGGARWNYLAGWAWAKKQPGGSDATAKEYIRKLFKNVPVLDTGARGCADHVLPSAISAMFSSPGRTKPGWPPRNWAGGKFEIVIPSISILAEPSVAVVDKVVLRTGTRTVAEEYLKYLYTPEGQEIAARNYYRPRNPDGGRQAQGAVPQAGARHHQGLRRLGQGAEGAFRRRRCLRPDLCSMRMS